MADSSLTIVREAIKKKNFQTSDIVRTGGGGVLTTGYERPKRVFWNFLEVSEVFCLFVFFIKSGH